MAVFGRAVQCPYTYKTVFYSRNGSPSSDRVYDFRRYYGSYNSPVYITCEPHESLYEGLPPEVQISSEVYITCEPHESLYDIFLGPEFVFGVGKEETLTPCNKLIYYISDLDANGGRTIPIGDLRTGEYLTGSLYKTMLYGDCMSYTYARLKQIVRYMGLTETFVDKIVAARENTSGTARELRLYNNHATLDGWGIIPY